MCDFDIANIRGRSSFAASQRKRRDLGLDSDSEDESPKKKSLNSTKKTTATSPTPTKSPEKPDATPNSTPSEPPVEKDAATKAMEETISSTEQYLAAAEALMAKPLPRQSPKPDKKSNSNSEASLPKENSSSFIELSDGEEEEEEAEEEDVVIVDAEIEDLDPSLAAFLSQSSDLTSTHKPQKITIKLQYVHNIEVTERIRSVVQKLMKPIKLIIMDTEQFHKVLNMFCQHKRLKKEEVVLTYKDDVVFLSGTPAGVGMSEFGTHHMQVYPRNCYEQMLDEKEQQKLERIKKWTADPIDDDDEPVESVSIPVTEETNDEERIILKLRGKDKNNDVQLRVKKTTTLESLVQSYKQHTGVTSNVKLSFEGETLDLKLTIEETDLEDKDLIEVN